MILPNSVPSHLTYSTTVLYPSKDFGFGIEIGIVKVAMGYWNSVIIQSNPVPSHPTQIWIGIVKKGICGTGEVAMTELLPNPVLSHPTYSTTILYHWNWYCKKRICGMEEVAMTELLLNSVPSHPTYSFWFWNWYCQERNMLEGGGYDRAIGDNQGNREDSWHLLLTSAAVPATSLHITKKTPYK